MAALPDPITQPLAVVDALFESHRTSAAAPAAQWGERAHFIRALGLDDEQNFSRIPCLNDLPAADMAKPFSLVRFRGLVQDVFEPEIYTAFLEEHDDGVQPEPRPPHLVTTKYRECIQPGATGRALRETGHENFGQRGACYMVPLPGETRWARDVTSSPPEALAATAAPPPPSATSRSKRRQRDEDDVEMSAEATTTTTTTGATGGAATTTVGTDLGLGAPATRRGRTASANVCTEAFAGVKSADEFGLNFPLPWEEKRGSGASTACIVKLYDEDAESLRVCETVEVLGVLCVNPEMANLDPAAASLFDLDARNPSTALVPRLHAIVVRKLPFFHPLFPFTPDWLSEARLAAAYQANLSQPGALAAARTAAVAQLARGLCGDVFAAEYVLMQLVSRSFRNYGDKALGAWSMNLSRWPQGADVGQLFGAISELTPRAVKLDVTSETLNGQKWRPTKDFQANRLVAGQLQLAHGTVLVVDETSLSPGQVSAPGVKALTALGELVTGQALTCDFMAYDVRIPLELSCIVVSSGASIIKALDAVVPLRPSTEPLNQSETVPLDATRLYLGLLTRQPKGIQISDALTGRISEDFSELRSKLQVPPELCHTWLSLARAMCVTHGEIELTAERWQSLLALERERLGRCKVAGVLG